MLTYLKMLWMARGRLKTAIIGCPEAPELNSVPRLIQVSTLATYGRSLCIKTYLLSIFAELHGLDTPFEQVPQVQPLIGRDKEPR